MDGNKETCQIFQSFGKEIDVCFLDIDVLLNKKDVQFENNSSTAQETFLRAFRKIDYTHEVHRIIKRMNCKTFL